MWRSFVALLGTVLVAVGSATPAAERPARLDIEARTGSVTSVLVPSEATLECDDGVHGTGFLRHVAKPACALVRKPVFIAVVTEHRAARLCTEAYGGPQRARITGTIGHRRVDVTIDRSDGCGIDDWNRLRRLLGAPERSGPIPRRRPSAATTTTAPPPTYRVQRGDTLTKIAKQFHTSVGAVVAANRLVDPDHLAEGQELVMPPPSAVRIDAELVDGAAEPAIGLTLVGAEPAELITFVVTQPDGSTHTGAPHTASAAGTVTTTYSTALGTGTYTVTATGERGTNAQTAFHVDPPD